MALKHSWHIQAQIDFNDTLAYIFREFGETSAEKFFTCERPLSSIAMMAQHYMLSLFGITEVLKNSSKGEKLGVRSEPAGNRTLIEGTGILYSIH